MLPRDTPNVNGGELDVSSAVRLYVGGLKADITTEDVAGRFRPFGEVAGVELSLDKANPASQLCRGFGYVSFLPKDARSLSRCLSLYNGCLWKGQKLRVEKAHSHYMERLRSEWVADQQQPLPGKDREDINAIPAPIESIFTKGADSVMLNLEERPSKVHAVPLVPAHTSLTHRKYFPPMKSNLSLEDASWSPIEHSYTRHELIRMGNERAGIRQTPMQVPACSISEQLQAGDRIHSHHSAESSDPPTSKRLAFASPPAAASNSHRPQAAAKRLKAGVERHVGSKKPVTESWPHTFMAAVSQGGPGAGPAGLDDRGPGERPGAAVCSPANEYDGGSSDSEDYAALRLAVMQRAGKVGNRPDAAEGDSSKGGFEVVPISSAAEPSSPVGDFSSFF